MKYEHETPPYLCHAPEQCEQIAQNLLLWQNPDGGWPKNKDWFQVLGPAERGAILAGRGAKKNQSTLDNGSTWSQLAYLAQVRRHSGSKAYDLAIDRGVNYLLASQRASGGWAGSDVDAITFNDRVMVGALGTLRQVCEDASLYRDVDPHLRSRAQAAFTKGLACLLRCQVRVGGRLTGWAQQHAHATCLPVWGRSYEPPVLATRESAEIVEFLLELKPPSRAVTQAIQAALAWLASIRIEGWRLVSRQAAPIAYNYHLSTTDPALVKDPEAPPLWARYYDPVTRKPVFASREGILLGRYEDLSRERRTGYEWFGSWPEALLKDRTPARPVRP
jgi:PelA/Pel-15E family pectate lyase